MIEVEINDVKYNVKQNTKDMTIKDYFDIQAVLARRQEGKKTEYLDGTFDVEYRKTEEESEDFKLEKTIDILHIISDIPKELFNEYPELVLEIESLVESFEVDKKIWKTKKIGNITWKYDQIKEWCFQQWVDCENASSDNLLYPFVISLYKYKVDDKTCTRKYDRFHPDFKQKLNLWLSQDAWSNTASITSFLSSIADAKTYYPYIYGDLESSSPEAGKYMKEYFKFVKWEDTIVSIAQTPVFNSSKGTLYAVRNANVIEVLQYLNIKRGRDYAEGEDYNNKHNNKTTI